MKKRIKIRVFSTKKNNSTKNQRKVSVDIIHNEVKGMFNNFSNIKLT